MILRDAEHHEIARVLPVRFAEFPECAANRIKPGGRHVDRAEAAMRGIVRGAELLRPPACQRLALIAPGEEGELARIGLADRIEPAGRDSKRFLPADLAEFAGAARADAQQRAAQPRRRVLRHDAGGALGAEHAAIDRMFGIAVDIADAAVAHMHANAATAGAHIAGRRHDRVAHERRGVDERFALAQIRSPERDGPRETAREIRPGRSLQHRRRGRRPEGPAPG